MRLPALPAAALACLALAIGCGGDKAPSSSSSGTGADEALTSDAENSNPLRHAATRLNGRREQLSKYRGQRGAGGEHGHQLRLHAPVRQPAVAL